MNDPLYAKDVLRLAAAATGAGTLEPSDARGLARNPICGDKIDVTLKLDDAGRIEAMAHVTHACVLAQASAAILGAHLHGSDIETVRSLRASVAAMLNGEPAPPSPFADYGALTGAADHRNRHTCVLLPIDAVLDALQSGR